MASTARLDELKKKFDENPRRYFAPLANEHRKSGDLDQAIALCRTHLPQQPAHISGHIVLAQALFEAGSLDEAREIFHNALGLDPENLIALRYLGDIARDADDVETARAWYQRVLEVDPRNDEIVQIVRDLDAPRPEPSESVEDAPEPVARASSTPQPAPSTPATPTAAENDARFAPIPIESLELDDAVDSPSAPTVDNFTASQASGSEGTIDATWTADSPTIELPALDASGVDPFDMDPAASADALFDANASSPAADDFFLTDVASAGDHAASEFDLTESTVVDPWAASQPEAEAPAASAEAEPTTFEEGAFYIDEAPASQTDEVHAEGAAGPPAGAEAMIDDSAFELPEAPPSQPVHASEPEAIIATADLTGAVSDAHSTDFELSAPVEDLAALPTEEWQAPAAVAPEVSTHASNDLGLEVMEFVPPSSEPSAPVAGMVVESDPLLGRTPELTTSHDATPPAFVTETMAELYLQQGFRNEALAVYRELLARNPADASLRERVEQIESGSLSSLGMANVSETVVESALRRQSARPAKSVRSFFASLAGRRAPTAASHATETSYATEHATEHAHEHTHEHTHDAALETEAAEQTAPDPVMHPGPAAHADLEMEPVQQAAIDSGSDDRIAPMMSAAESLASFDPFADSMEQTLELPAESAETESTDSVFGLDSFASSPNAEPMAPEPDATSEAIQPSVAQPNATQPSPPSEPQASAEPARRTLEDLFPDTPVTPRAEAAAQTLATAFGRTEPQGRPTRAANSELSLDKVFRGAPEGAPPTDGGFSFDQFFSDARPSAGSDVAAPAFAPPEGGRSPAAAGDSHDIEQFTAWLEGLKKK